LGSDTNFTAMRSTAPIGRATSSVNLGSDPKKTTVDFISDLHLHASEPATFAAWQHYMQSTPADAVFILGDLFEVWVGDDVVGDNLASLTANFEDQCAQVLGEAATRLSLFFMHGNRDFLVGQRLMDLCNMTLLTDPTVLVFPSSSSQRYLLSHGDALCLGDVDYMQFRQQVRSPEWQQAFLAKPLAERQAIARGLRQQSEAKKQSGADYADVDRGAALQWLQAANAKTLIHGHTHKPATHQLDAAHQRIVLSDWDASARPPRAEVLRLTSQGLQRIPLL
jgi:UDP-2,3-diacylglucosamine hydrolase